MFDWGVILSLVATGVAVLAFLRTVSQGLPTVEFLVERDQYERAVYKLSVSNPTRRLLVLDYIRVLSPDIVTSFARPVDTTRDTVERVWEDLSRSDPELRAAFLAVPAGETKYLEILLGGETDDEELDIDFRFVWSKGLPHWDRWLMPRRVTLDSTQVKSRKIAALKEGP